MKRYPEWMLHDLEESGLTAEDAEKMQLEPLTEKETYELSGVWSESYKIPYWDLAGNRTEHFRLKLRDSPRVH